MTDEQVIKSLEYCKTHRGACTDECAYRAMFSGGCASMLQKDTFNLIKRQKEKIEMLEIELKEVKSLGVNKIAEIAIKDFAEKMKIKLEECRKEYNGAMNPDGACAMIIAKSIVDKALVEMEVKNAEIR